MMSKSFQIGISIFNALVLLYLLSPLLVVIFSSFGESPYMQFPPKGFTLKWFAEALNTRAYLSGFWSSATVATIVAVIATTLGTMASWALVRYTSSFRTYLESFLLLPITLPHLILGIGILTFTQSMGMNGTLLRLIIAHIVITVPYTIRILVPVIVELSADIEEAAANLGAAPGTIFRTITMPLIAPTILICFGVAFMVSFDELVLALFLAPPGKLTLPLVIFSKVEFSLEPSIGAVSTMLLAATFGLMLLGSLLTRSRFAPSKASHTQEK